MAFSDLASNQMVTYTDAQTSGFPLKAGQSHVTSNQCMTKVNILTKYNVTISGYADNQLVPKSAWISSVSGTAIYLSSITFQNYADVYEVELDLVKYVLIPPQVGTVIYNDISCTSPFDCNGYWKLATGSEAYQINSFGVIVDTVRIEQIF